VVLLPVTWENSSYPAFGAHPQSLINEQTLVGCDLLIACFGPSAGTPTENYDSGTIEEIETFAASGRNTLVYFSKSSYPVNEINPKQLQRRNEFKESMKSRGLFGEFTDPQDLQTQVDRALVSIVNELNFNVFTSVLDGGDAFTSDSIYSPLETQRTNLMRKCSRWNVQWNSLKTQFSGDGWKSLAYEISEMILAVVEATAVALDNPEAALIKDLQLVYQESLELAEFRFTMAATINIFASSITYLDSSRKWPSPTGGGTSRPNCPCRSHNLHS